MSYINNNNNNNNININNNNNNLNNSKNQINNNNSSELLFNPLTHFPPQYDIYGRIKPNKHNLRYNILSQKDNIKIPWNKNISKSQSFIQTRSQLLDFRKKQRIPDISYDLDKDGYVGNKDYVISKIYDVDNDGKLNEIEKKNAYEGIKNGIEKKFLWNLDNQGGKGAYRVMQKRGKIIENENFIALQDTYPKYPFKENENRICSYEKLKEFRKKENIKNFEKNILNYEKNHPREIIIKTPKKNILSVSYDNKNIETKKEKINKQARLRASLSELPYDIKNIKIPSLKYIKNPSHKTYEDVLNDFKEENLKLEKDLYSKKFINNVERLNMREDEIFSRFYNKGIKGKTYEDIKQNNLKKILEYNLNTFSQRPIGIHRHKLPKFSENEEKNDFWKFNENYCENPKFSSQIEYLENNKFWKKKENLLINEHQKDDVSIELGKFYDPYNRDYFPKKNNKVDEKDLIINLNKINIFKNFDPNVIKKFNYKYKPYHILRWSCLMNKFNPNKLKGKRFFDSFEKEKNENEKGKEKINNKIIKNKEIKNDKNDINKNIEKIIKPLPKKDVLFYKFSNEKDSVKLNKVYNKVFSSAF